MPTATKDRDFILDFIEIYKISPCLWKKTDRQYHNTHIREAAYTRLLDKYKEYNENATMAMVKAKINNIRSTFNKEIKKIKDSERSGAGTGEIYKPVLWYYDLLSFLSDRQSTQTSMNTTDEDENGEADDSQSISDRDGGDDQSDQEVTRPSPPPSCSTERKRSARSSKKEATSNKKVLQLVAERLRKTDDREGKHDSFGKHVAEELNNMAPEMTPHVKKIISLAIYEGHMKTLNTSSSIVTQQVSSQFSPQNHIQTPQPSHLATNTHFLRILPISSTNTSPPGNHASASQYFSHFSDK